MKKLFKGCLTIVGILFVLGVIGAIINGGRTAQPAAAPAAPAAAGASATNQAVASSNQEAAAQPEPTAVPSYAVGQDVQVDEVRWKILEAVDLGTTLTSENQFIEDKTSGGRFVRVRFEVENQSKDLLSFTGIDLLDDQGRSYTRASDIISFLPQEELCFLENLNPNVPKTCSAIYEVPANAAGLKLEVTDLKAFGSASALVELGIVALFFSYSKEKFDAPAHAYESIQPSGTGVYWQHMFW